MSFKIIVCGLAKSCRIRRLPTAYVWWNSAWTRRRSAPGSLRRLQRFCRHRLDQDHWLRRSSLTACRSIEHTRPRSTTTFSQASTMRENLHCWRAGATATPLSSLNHSSLPRPTLFAIASCASYVTTACSIDVRAHNIILTYNVARRRTDRLRGSPKQSQHLPAANLRPLRTRNCTSPCSAKRHRGKPFSEIVSPSAARHQIVPLYR